MFVKYGDIRHYSLQAIDGSLGKGRDILFDDSHWTVRYIDINTSQWLVGRRVLISPYSIQGISPMSKTIMVLLNKEQIKNSPDLAEHEPISDKFERLYHNYFGYPGYWTGYEIWGASEYPILVNAGQAKIHEIEYENEKQRIAKSHIRSMKEIRGYALQTESDVAGKVLDFIVDDKSWKIQYLVVTLRSWFPGLNKLVPTSLIKDVSWEKQCIDLATDKNTLKNAPAYHSEVTRQDEINVLNYFGLKPYWHTSPVHSAVNA